MANLAGASLSGAKLDGATLFGANLTEAKLDGADLTSADLTRANLTRANLTRADLTEAKLAGTLLGNLDLSATKGLDRVVHSGPSSLGVDTLYRSRGKIPDEFLTGVGLSRLFITYARDTINAESGPLFAYYSAFLSYSHADQKPVRAIYEQLTQRGIPCWLDEHQLSPGDKLDTYVDQAIRGADKVVVFCSKASLGPGSNWWVDREVGRALDQERDRSRRQLEDVTMLIPVDLDGYLFSEECEYSRKTDLTARNVAKHRPDRDPTDSIIEALSTRSNRLYQPFFDPARHKN